jgi:histidine triad (HIT) family protein
MEIKVEDNCVFCKIIRKEINSHIVYEDETVLAFLDIGPVNPGHTLVIPKKHSTNLLDISEEDLKTLILAVRKICPAILKATAAHGLNVSMNNGKAAGQLVNHTHFHIIPRFAEDGFKHWSHSKYKGGEADDALNKIRKELAKS